MLRLPTAVCTSSKVYPTPQISRSLSFHGLRSPSLGHITSITKSSSFLEFHQRNYSTRRGGKGDTKRTGQKETGDEDKKKDIQARRRAKISQQRAQKQESEGGKVKKQRPPDLLNIQEKRGALRDDLLWLRTHNETFEPPEDIPTITIFDLRDRLDSNEKPLIIDLRDDLRGEPLIPKSIHVPVPQLADDEEQQRDFFKHWLTKWPEERWLKTFKFSRFDVNKEMIFCSTTGKRSEYAVKCATAAGYTNVKSLFGGARLWNKYFNPRNAIEGVPLKKKERVRRKPAVKADPSLLQVQELLQSAHDNDSSSSQEKTATSTAS